MVAFQTTEPVVSGSNPASMENSEDRQSHCVYSKISGQRGTPSPLRPKTKNTDGKANRRYITEGMEQLA